MRGVILPLPQYVFMAWCLVKHRDKFTFTLPGTTVQQPVTEHDFGQVHEIALLTTYFPKIHPQFTLSKFCIHSLSLHRGLHHVTCTSYEITVSYLQYL
jgi:hypothetical protein